MASEVNNPETVNAAPEVHGYVGDISLGTKKRSPDHQGEIFVIDDPGAMLNPTDDSCFSYQLAF